MTDLLELHKYFISAHLKQGGTAVDFTMGNGHDTAWLSKTVGEAGRIYAFDIQPSAIDATRRRLTDEGCPDNCTLILDSHSEAAKYISGEIDAGMFNLGYLPGGDKSLTTRRETTLPAISGAINMLAHGGILLVAVYPGHPEGEAEGVEIEEYLSTLDRRHICCSKFIIVNSPTSPFFFIIEKK